jgi:hypothetical protein
VFIFLSEALQPKEIHRKKKYLEILGFFQDFREIDGDMVPARSSGPQLFLAGRSFMSA